MTDTWCSPLWSCFCSFWGQCLASPVWGRLFWRWFLSTVCLGWGHCEWLQQQHLEDWRTYKKQQTTCQHWHHPLLVLLFISVKNKITYSLSKMMQNCNLLELICKKRCEHHSSKEAFCVNLLKFFSSIRFQNPNFITPLYTNLMVIFIIILDVEIFKGEKSKKHNGYPLLPP